MQAETEVLDCLVIGGGAAGLAAAVYLARFRRKVLVVDAGDSRVQWIPHSHNLLGFPDGIAGPALLERMRQHAGRYSVPLQQGRVDGLRRLSDGAFEARVGERQLRARCVLMTTGARDVAPDIAGLAGALKCGLVRYCPVCDGYETQGQRVAVLGSEIHGLRESLFVAGFDNRVTWLSMGSRRAVSEKDISRLQACGVDICDEPPGEIRCVPGEGVTVSLAGGRQLRFDVLYPALGQVHVSELASALGARTLDDGQLAVDSHQRTSVAGLYAAGDVADGLNQIGVAAGQAAIAATAIHNSL